MRVRKRNRSCEGMFLTMGQAAALCPGNPSRGTLRRWHTDGVLTRDGGRVRLRAQRAGRRFITTTADLAEFLDALAQADAGLPRIGTVGDGTR